MTASCRESELGKTTFATSITKQETLAEGNSFRLGQVCLTVEKAVTSQEDLIVVAAIRTGVPTSLFKVRNMARKRALQAEERIIPKIAAGIKMTPRAF